MGGNDVAVAVGTGVGGTDVAVGSTGVAVGWAGVEVAGPGVDVGGTGVAVAGTEVDVGVAVGGTGVAVSPSSPLQPATANTSAIPKISNNPRLRVFFIGRIIESIRNSPDGFQCIHDRNILG